MLYGKTFVRRAQPPRPRGRRAWRLTLAVFIVCVLGIAALNGAMRRRPTEIVFQPTDPSIPVRVVPMTPP